MNRIKTQAKCSLYLIYVAAFCILFFLLWKLPLLSDDFEFADIIRTKSVNDILHYILYYGNGRLLGNSMAITMVNANVVLSATVKAIAVLGIIILLPRILGLNSISAFLVSFLLVLGTAPQIYAQVFIWTSGFVNFTFSVFLSLLCVYLVQTATKPSSFQKLLISVLGISSQLFVEHLSIINTVVATGMVWYFYRKDTIKRDAALHWLIGCILGAALMILLPRIFYIDGNRTQGYREVHADSIATMLHSVINALQFMIATLSRCTLLFSATSLFGWLMRRGTRGIFNCIVKSIYLLFPVFSILYNIRAGIWIPAIIRYGAIYGGLLVYCLVLAIDVLKITNKEQKTSLICLIILAMLSAAPFLIVTPFGERCLFLAYSFLAMFAIKALFYAVDYQQIRFSKEKYLLITCSIVLSVILLTETTNIRNWNTERNRYIETCMANGEKSICIFEIPSVYSFKTYLIGRWYYNTSWHDVHFEVLEYETWLEHTSKE